MGEGGVREIALTKGYVAIVDAADFDWLSQWRWTASARLHGVYAKAWFTDLWKNQYLHRVILGAAAGEMVDHINRDRLDNRRCNLRICDARQNVVNAIRPLSACGFRGVDLTESGLYRATIRDHGKAVRLGRFQYPEEAAAAYDSAARVIHGEFAILNFPEAT